MRAAPRAALPLLAAPLCALLAPAAAAAAAVDTLERALLVRTQELRMDAEGGAIDGGSAPLFVTYHITNVRARASCSARRAPAPQRAEGRLPCRPASGSPGSSAARLRGE